MCLFLHSWISYTSNLWPIHFENDWIYVLGLILKFFGVMWQDDTISHTVYYKQSLIFFLWKHKNINRYIIIKEHKNTTIVISIWWQLKSGKIPYQTLLNMLDPKQQHRPFFCDSGKIYWVVCKSKRGFSCTHNNINYHMWTEMLIETKLTVQFFCHTHKVCWDR